MRSLPRTLIFLTALCCLLAAWLPAVAGDATVTHDPIVREIRLPIIFLNYQNLMVNPQDRQVSLDFYKQVYLASEDVAPQWTGNYEAQEEESGSFEPKSPIAMEVASSARLLVDVEFGRGHTLYALAQDNWDGAFTVITDGLDRPTSLELIGNTAYGVTLTGQIWKIDGVAGPSYHSLPQ